MTRIGALLRKSPALFRLAFSLHVRFRALVDLPRYLFCRLANRVYFGPVMLGAQTWPSRAPHMRAVINQEMRRNGRQGEMRVLEIGSWAGQSAILWASEIASSGCSGRVVCIDPWMPFATKGQVGLNTATTTMDRVAARDKIFPLFWHNVKSSGLSEIILPLRGRSNDLLPLLKPLSFDLVFVDGSHAYSDFIIDLRLAATLLKEGGVLCGDDLELQREEVDATAAEKNREKDYVADPVSGLEYHPGVCLGVADFFRRSISCRDGFWAQRKTGDGWTDVHI